MSSHSHKIVVFVTLLYLPILGCSNEPAPIEPSAGYNYSKLQPVLPGPDDPVIDLGRIPLHEDGTVTKGPEHLLKIAQGCVFEVTVVPDNHALIPGGAASVILLSENGDHISQGELSVIEVKDNTVGKLQDAKLRPYLAQVKEPGRYFVRIDTVSFLSDMKPRRIPVYEAPLLVE